MFLFRKNTGKKSRNQMAKTYDKQTQKPVLKCSICNGEQVAGFQDIHTGKFEEVMFIRNPADLEDFKEQYGIEGDIKKIY